MKRVLENSTNDQFIQNLLGYNNTKEAANDTKKRGRPFSKSNNTTIL